MKNFNHILFASLIAAGSLTGCSEDLLNVNNNNQMTTDNFGNDAVTLQEAVIAAYNHIRMEGTFGRVGYNFDVCRGDEAWNSSQVWYLPFDDLNSEVTNEMNCWVYRDWLYTVNVCNYVLSKIPASGVSTAYDRMRGQALFLRGLSYYMLTGYYQNVPLITDYTTYGSLDGLYCGNNTQKEIIEQIKTDLKEAVQLLPKRDEGGEWAQGRATQGAAAGLLGKVLMFNHEYSEAKTILEGIINGQYGTYRLMENYGANFQEGKAYENNDESLFEVQFLDNGMQGTDDEWTPVNTSANATQGHAIESNFAAGSFGGWADISGSTWLYNLFKAEKTKDGKLDPRLYWTLGTYETDWTESYPAGGYGNVYYTNPVTAESNIVTNNNNGGIPIVKNTNARTGVLSAVVTGLKCGINLRIIRLADIYLLAAEAINEVSGPNQTAIDYINIVRRRANLNDLQLGDFANADALFEQIANVERPKELGCEFGRGFDLIRWGWFYNDSRMAQLKQHGAVKLTTDLYTEYPVASPDKTSYDNYRAGHEYIPYYQKTLNDNPNLGEGNSANTSVANTPDFNIRNVVSGIGL
jgi:hypothetical protein